MFSADADLGPRLLCNMEVTIIQWGGEIQVPSAPHQQQQALDSALLPGG